VSSWFSHLLEVGIDRLLSSCRHWSCSCCWSSWCSGLEVVWALGNLVLGLKIKN